MFYECKILMSVGVTRTVINRPYTFSNGISLPPGTVLGVPILPVHTDETIYHEALVFDGFRFSRIREESGDNAKLHAANTSYDYLNFGHGQHAWYVR